ncbi:hypothetical protein [Humisphaera borealis]|uniref:Uncharacterized protein n=1 Tax=Humisphaera borealis TaxID=2807512 RepID=A0A7M2WT29_9BACT|nr:hypothetical protein [Humisphaera borealis]QOV88583.1 hypothetical protein IPV69_20415 [Humisphaera borealis]
MTPGNVPPMAPQRPGQPPATAAARPATPAQDAPFAINRPAAPPVSRPATPHAEMPPANEEPAGPVEGVAVHLDGATAGYQGTDQAASGLESVVADDADEVNVPPAPIEYLGHTHHVQPTNGPAFVPKYQAMSYKQTLIPILLTTGLCLAALGACRFVLPRDTPLGNLPIFIPIILFVAAAAALAFGVLSMLQVKNALDQQALAKAAAAQAAGG